MNEISSTKKFKIDSFHKNVKAIEIEIIKPYEVANKLNKLFTRIDLNLASSITNTSKSLKYYYITYENDL